MAATPLPIGSAVLLFLDNVKDVDGNAITDADVEYEIRSKYTVDGSYQTVDSGSLPHVSGGDYQKTITADVMDNIVDKRRYYVFYRLTSSEGNMLKRTEHYGDYQ